MDEIGGDRAIAGRRGWHGGATLRLRVGWLGMLVAGVALMLTAAPAQARLQCVPYARSVSGIEIYGDAHLWWGKAADRYERGSEPRVGAVLAFRSTAAMPLGHVAVVSEILDERRIILDHANWSGPGVIETEALALDVSEGGDWSAVRVWYGPTRALGARTNPTYGFIYDTAPETENIASRAAPEGDIEG